MGSRELRTTCFVLAADSAEVGALIDVVEQTGATPLILEDLAPRRGTLVDLIREALERADVVVGALSVSVPNDSTIFEIGMAAALGKPTIVVTPPRLALPAWPVMTMTVRDSGPEYGGLQLALREVLGRLAQGPRDHDVLRPPRRVLRPIGSVRDELLRDLEAAGREPPGSVLVDIIHRALAAGGADPVQGGADARFDLGVWDPEFEAFFGNPLVIEVKPRLPNVDSIMRALAQVEHYLGATGGRWALLVYASGDDSTVRDVSWTRPVLTVNLRELLLALGERSFSDYMRHLRAERLHAGPFK